MNCSPVDLGPRPVSRSGLVAIAGVVLVIAGVLGPQRTSSVTAALLQMLFAAFFLRHFGFAVAAMRNAPLDLANPPPIDRTFTPRVSVLVACHNEQAVVERLVRALTAIDYPKSRLQIIIVDDQSTDASGEILDRLAAQCEQLEIIHRASEASSGKSAALNAALRRVTGEVVVVFDADHHPHAQTVHRLVGHFRDPNVAAVQGRCEIGNPTDSLLARLISIDYMAGYLVNEYGRQCLYQLPAYGGANCAVRTSSLRAVGGWNEDSVTEDTDLTMRLMLGGERVRFDVNAVDREEGVITLKAFWRQRYRWARGHQQVWRDYRKAVFRSRRLTLMEKIETQMFLFIFHLPAVSILGLALVAAWIAGIAIPVDPMNAVVFWTLLFLGGLLELGAGLIIARGSRRDAIAIAFFLPLFFVSIAVCMKAWVDSFSGRTYRWVKTARAGDPEVAGAAL